MPRSSKRTYKARRDSPRVDVDVDVDADFDDVVSSPTRPLKRRRKINNSPPPPADDDEDEASSQAAEHSGIDGYDEQEVSRIIPYLQKPPTPVQASRDHANEMHENNAHNVQAYAKIAARNWTFYVNRAAINIGRSSDPPTEAEDDDRTIHIDLGPSKMVSRLHARLSFNSETEKWHLDVKGRNGAKVDGQPLKQGMTYVLGSGQVVEVAGVEMMFILPLHSSPLRIHESFRQRCRLPRPEDTDGEADVDPDADVDLDPEVDGDPELDRDPETAGARARAQTIIPRSQAEAEADAEADEDAITSLPTSDSLAPSRDTQGARRRRPRTSSSQQQQQPIALVPPDPPRPGTPPPRSEQSPTREGRTLGLKGTAGLDLSHDDSQHMKPQYSYAQLITQAIMQTPDGKLNLNGIYNFIMTKYSYYRHQHAAGWQNSIRHNLSLNKAFDKVARSTDEPGKGMKWHIVPEAKDEMTRNAYRIGRGGHRGSSAPSSPAGNLNYISQGPRDLAAREPTTGRKSKASPMDSPTPQTSSRVPLTATPDRRLRSAEFSSAPRRLEDGSPPARSHLSASAAPTSSFSNVPQSPTLTSSYLPEDSASFITPAPPRVHLRLAPPSTVQRPSQHMPTSSPAPFWKYADIGSTPLKPPAHFELSPSRPGATPFPQSSSPPRGPKSPIMSPAAPPATNQQPAVVDEAVSESRPALDDQKFDLTKGFQSIGSYHNPIGRSIAATRAQLQQHE